LKQNYYEFIYSIGLHAELIQNITISNNNNGIK